MVKLTEVEDEYFAETQPGPHDEDDEYVDTDSSVSDSSDDEDDVDETLYDRIVALKDIMPATHRARLSKVFGATYGALASSLVLGGKTLWVVSTSAIMLAVPYAIAVGDEQQYIEMEKEMQAQQLATGALSPNAQTPLDAQLKA